jgi:hypothetical protein
MKQVTYAGSSFATGSAIADAIVRLTTALGSSQATASVTVPCFDAHGKRTTVDLVVGPASEVFAILIDSDVEELVDDAVVRELDARAEEAGPPHAVASREPVEATPAWPEI